MGFKDINQDGNFEFPEDAFGGYDVNSDHLADLITIIDGEALSNINFAITIPPEVTAREKFTTAEDIAQTFYPDAMLSVIGSDPTSPAGKAQSWLYGFYSTIGDTLLGVGHLGDLFFTFPFPQNGGDGNGNDGPVQAVYIPLPENWIDSDVAADSAEANGGSDFRNMYLDAQINAFASTFILSDMAEMPLEIRNQHTFELMLPDITQHAKSHITFYKTMAASDTLFLWIFFYFSEEAGEMAQVILDAETGSPVEGPGPAGEPTSARSNLDPANQAALNWAADAVLVQIGNLHPDLTPEGFAVGWGFAYYSPGKDSVRGFFLVDSLVVEERSFTKNDMHSLETLPEGWLDTPIITPTAEAASGDFRNQHVDAEVKAILSRGIFPGDLSAAYWVFIYESEADTATLHIFIDPLTGNIITDIDEVSTSANMPASFALEQNYPNPFNPETIIKYKLKENSEVELIIYDILGQLVKTLVNQKQPAGIYKVYWDAKDQSGKIMPSGIYFYSLKAGSFNQIRRMILLH
jgi:hypothetical protein